MIRHILFIKTKPDTSPAQLRDVQQAFSDIPQKIDGIETVEWGENSSPENKNKGFDYCVQMTFRDIQARDSYLPHPEHIALKKIFSPILEDIIVLDYVAAGH